MEGTVVILSPCVPRVYLEAWINDQETKGYDLQLITPFVMSMNDDWTGVAVMRQRTLTTEGVPNGAD